VSDPTEIVYFEVTGTYVDAEAPDPGGSTNALYINIITAFVTFYPRVPLGFTVPIANFDLTQVDAEAWAGTASAALALPPIPARILSGQVQTINYADTPGIMLTSNSAAVQAALQAIDPTWLEKNNLEAGQLVYDVSFSNVVYADSDQTILPFGFVAPTDTTPVCISDPLLTRLAYGGP
jgi:hypothetical protein